MIDGHNKKVVAAGHICLDITPAFPKDKIKQVSEMLVPGRLIQMGSADVHMGGAVANTGLAMKILGADVKLMGKVGSDAFGELILSQLNQYEASDGMIISEDTDTSYSVVLAPVGIDRIFLHHSGANDNFTSADLDFDTISEASLFHFGYPPIMKKLYESEGTELLNIFKQVKETGAATSLDMAAVDESSPAGKADWEQILKKLLPYVDFFVPSVEELAFMIDRPRYQDWVKRAAGQDITSVISIEKDVKPLADLLLNWGAKVVLIKCGAPGLYFRTGSKEAIARVGGGLAESLLTWADQEHFEKSYQPDQILSGTGAGDTSIAAFLCSILNGYSWEMSLKYAAGTGASCVAAYDALSGLKSFQELQSKIEAGWEKN